METRRALLGLAAALVAVAGLVAAWLSLARDAPEKRTGGSTLVADPATASLDEPDVLAREKPPATVDERRVAAETGPSSTLMLAVLAEGDAPVVDAEVLLFTQSGLLARGTTDARGELAAAAPTEPARAVVRPHRHAPSLHEVPAAAGRCVLRLPPGEMLAGVLVVDGEPPHDPVELTVVGDHPWFDFGGMSPEVRAILLAEPFGSVNLRGDTGVAGAFSFEGLAPGNSWSIRLPADLRTTRALPGGRLEWRGPRFERASANIRIEARTMPVLTGRFVDRISREPIEGVRGTAYLSSPGSTTELGVGPSDAEGRFRCVLSAAARDGVDQMPTKGELSVAPPASYERRELSFEPPGSSGTVDLGDVELEPAAAGLETHVRVVDRAGTPVAGARLWFDDDPAGRIAQTNEDGGAALAGREDWRELVVVAFGLVTARTERPVDSGSTSAAPWTITLDSLQAISVEVDQPLLPSCEGMSLELSSSAELFDDEAAGIGIWTRADRLGLPPLLAARHGENGSNVEFWLDQPRARIDALRSGIPIVVTLRDGIGAEVHRFPELVLAPGERRDLRHSMDEPFGRFEGRAIDEEGVPLVQASVHLIVPGLRGAYQHTDEEGRVRFENLLASAFDAEVQKQGYVTWHGAGISMPREGAFEFRLERGRTVRVRIVDEDGGLVEASVKAPAVYAEREDVGVYRFDDLADGTLALVADVAGRRYEREHSTDDPECEIRVPNHGRVRVRVPRGTTTADRESLYVVLDPKVPELARRELWLPPGTDGVVELGPVLPGSYEIFLESSEAGTNARVPRSPRRPVEVEARAEILLDL